MLKPLLTFSDWHPLAEVTEYVYSLVSVLNLWNVTTAWQFDLIVFYFLSVCRQSVLSEFSSFNYWRAPLADVDALLADLNLLLWTLHHLTSDPRSAPPDLWPQISLTWSLTPDQPHLTSDPGSVCRPLSPVFHLLMKMRRFQEVTKIRAWFSY